MISWKIFWILLAHHSQFTNFTKMGDLLCQADVRSDLDDPVLRAYLAVYKSCLGQRFYTSEKRLILEEEPHYPGMGSDNIDIVARNLLGQCANAAMMSMLPLEEICTIDWFMHLVCPAWEKPPLFKWWRTTQMLLQHLLWSCLAVEDT